MKKIFSQNTHGEMIDEVKELYECAI